MTHKYLSCILLLMILSLVFGCTTKVVTSETPTTEEFAPDYIEKLPTPITSQFNNFSYVINGVDYNVQFVFYQEINEYFKNKERGYYPSRGETEATSIIKKIDNNYQNIQLVQVRLYFTTLQLSDDEKIRAITSFVQNIQYDHIAANTDAVTGKYPYEVLYTNIGVCGEKSQLLAYMYKSLGYGVALFDFNAENHEAVGISCQQQYSYKNTGYCFVESTTPSLITDADGNYAVVGKLLSYPKVTILQEGKLYDATNDFINNKKLYDFDKYDIGDYSEIVSIRNKYGLSQKTCDSVDVLCNGFCYLSCDINEIYECTPTEGLICKLDPKNCPIGKTACNNECYSNCDAGVFTCESTGAICYI